MKNLKTCFATTAKEIGYKEKSITAFLEAVRNIN